MPHRIIRSILLSLPLAVIQPAAHGQTDGLYWFGSLASSGEGMLTTDGKINYIGSGYNGPYNYFVTMDEDATVQSFTTHAVVGRSSSQVGYVLTSDGHLLRGMNSIQPGTNIPELVLSLTDPAHAVAWTRTYSVPGYRGSRCDARLGWTIGEDFLIQVTFLDSNHTGSARTYGLLRVDREGDAVWTKTSDDLTRYTTFDTLPDGDYLFGTSAILTRTDALCDPIWSRNYASDGVPQHNVLKPVDVGPTGDIRMLWNMGDTTFQFPAGGSATWPTYAGLLSIDPASGDIQDRRRLDQGKPVELHGITALGTGDFMLYGGYNTLRPYLPSYMRVHGLLQKVTPSGDILSVDTFSYTPQLKSSEILHFEEVDGRAVMSINLHDGTNPSRYLATMDPDGEFPCEMYPSSAISAGTVTAMATDEPLWQLTDRPVEVVDLTSVLSPASVNIVQVCSAIHTGVRPAHAPDPVFQVWPNPTTGPFTIDLPGQEGAVHVRIVDMQGREVHRGRAQSRMDLDVSTWPAGSYAISVVDDKGVRHARLVVQH